MYLATTTRMTLNLLNAMHLNASAIMVGLAVLFAITEPVVIYPSVS